MAKTNVLIVDDSMLITELLVKIISSDDSLAVVGTATDPYDARDKIKTLNPDVITLDIEMPRMDGLTFLKNVMRLRPIPVVMISTLTQKGADATLEALESGAVDFVAKPTMNVSSNMEALSEEICKKIRAASKANVQALESSNALAQEPYTPSPVKVDDISSCNLSNKVDLIAIGGSTGGTLALKAVVCKLPDIMPPIVVVQHMPENFTKSFSANVNKVTRLTAEEFVDNGQTLKPGHIYIANGGSHMEVKKTGGVIKGYLLDAPPVNRHRPAVDVLFSSVAKWSENNVIGVLLTGMGADGAQGLGELREGGAETIAQDEASSVVWGMPRVAVEQDAANHVLPLSKISDFLVDRCCQ